MTFEFNGHVFTVDWGGWWGGSRVFYDDRCVSRTGASFRTRVHVDFSVIENGQSVRYDVALIGMRIPIDVEVRRDGVLIYCRSKGGLTEQPVTSPS